MAERLRHAGTDGFHLRKLVPLELGTLRKSRWLASSVAALVRTHARRTDIPGRSPFKAGTSTRAVAQYRCVARRATQRL